MYVKVFSGYAETVAEDANKWLLERPNLKLVEASQSTIPCKRRVVGTQEDDEVAWLTLVMFYED